MKTQQNVPDIPSGTSDKVIKVTITPIFKMVFLTVLGLTVICLLIGCSLVGLTVSLGRNLTTQENVLFDLCTSTFKLGFGAMIGMFGAKAL
jgi:uncharacterized membrane protein